MYSPNFTQKPGIDAVFGLTLNQNHGRILPSSCHKPSLDRRIPQPNGSHGLQTIVSSPRLMAYSFAVTPYSRLR
jgi:hypothetical protein